MARFHALRWAIAPWIVLSGFLTTTSLATPPLNDPSEDTFGSPMTAHDISNLDALVSPNSVTFAVDFYNMVAAPSAFSANSVVGFIDIDLDQDASTGVVAKKNLFSPAGDSHLGTEFHIDLFSERFHAGEAEVINTATVQPVGVAAVMYGATGFSVIVPLSLLGGDDLFNYGLIVGDFLDMSDEAPNGGFGTTVPEPSGIALTLTACLLGATKRGLRTHRS
jgi:hypothetical protein